MNLLFELTRDEWVNIVEVVKTLLLFFLYFRVRYWRRRFFDLKDGVQRNVARMERAR